MVESANDNTFIVPAVAGSGYQARYQTAVAMQWTYTRVLLTDYQHECCFRTSTWRAPNLRIGHLYEKQHDILYCRRRRVRPTDERQEWLHNPHAYTYASMTTPLTARRVD